NHIDISYIYNSSLHVALPISPRRGAAASHVCGTRHPPGVAHHHQNTAEPRTGRTNPVARLRWTAGVRGANGNPDRRNTTKNNTTPQKKRGSAAATALPSSLPTHVSRDTHNPETGIPTCVGKTLQVFLQRSGTRSIPTCVGS